MRVCVSVARLNDVDCVVIAFNDDWSLAVHTMNVDCIILASYNDWWLRVLTAFQLPVLLQQRLARPIYVDNATAPPTNLFPLVCDINHTGVRYHTV